MNDSIIERPILFNGPMVRAILEGRKTQTRRVMKAIPKGWGIDTPPVMGSITSKHPKQGKYGVFIRRGVGTEFPEADIITCPYGKPSDRLWVRETLRLLDDNGIKWWAYDADKEWLTSKLFGSAYLGERLDPCKSGLSVERGYIPSIHMPRWACRILLEITNIRVERVQDISEEAAKREGAQFADFGKDGWGKQRPGWRLDKMPEHTGESLNSAKWAFCNLWNKINASRGYGWDANPWVWVMEFKQVDHG